MGIPKGYKHSSSPHKWTDEEKEYLKEICFDKSYKEIASLMTNKFNYEFKTTQVQSAIKRYGLTTGRSGYFKKGSEPWNKGKRGYMGANKTSFKKGMIPKNHKPVGTERVDNREGYIKIKIKEPDKWELKHKFIYESHYGKIKKGNVVIFLDGNKNNFDINNLKCITREQLLTLNKNNLIKKNANLTELGIEVANLIIKSNEIKRNNMRNSHHRWSNEEKEYIKEISKDRPIREIRRLMTEKFNYEYSYQQITSAMRRYNCKNGISPRFEKGFTPWNKGRKCDDIIPWNKGKKMGPSYNRCEIGTEHIDSKGYTLVKVENPDKWKLKHHLIYEKHYGEIEKGYCIIFADKNKTNFNIDNLIKVKTGDLMIMNLNGLVNEDAELTKVGVNVAKLISQTNKKAKKK